MPLILALLPPGAAAAQVGHAPEHSPYSDLRSKQAVSAVVVYVGGTRVAAQVGPSNGLLFGVRYDRQVGTAVDIQLGLGYGRLERYLVDPTKTPDTRLSGPTHEDVVTMETGVALVLTGRKTWHGFIPYVGAGLGVVFDTQLTEDASGYSFGTKGTISPHLGVKWFPIQAFAVKVEGRALVWRLSYPTQFFAPPVGYTVAPVLKATDPNAEWTVHPTLILSVGYTFTF